MGWLGDFFNGLFGFAKNERQIAANRSLQEDAQAFNFEMQKDAQRYNSAEAEKAFARQEEFYIKHSSPAAQIASLRSAGVNPFSLGGTGSGPVASSSPASSGVASSGIGSVGTLSNPLDTIIQMARLKMEQSSVEADNRLKYAQADNLDQRTPFEVQKLMSEIAELDERAQLHVANLDKVLNESALAFKSLGLTDKQIEHYDALIAKLSSEVKTIDAIRDYEKRIKSAEAAIAEFEASVAELTKDLSSGNKASVDDFVAAFVKIFLTKFVGK